MTTEYTEGEDEEAGKHKKDLQEKEKEFDSQNNNVRLTKSLNNNTTFEVNPVSFENNEKLGF